MSNDLALEEILALATILAAQRKRDLYVVRRLVEDGKVNYLVEDGPTRNKPNHRTLYRVGPDGEVTTWKRV